MIDLRGVVATEILLRGEVDLEAMAPAPGMSWNADAGQWQDAAGPWSEES